MKKLIFFCLFLLYPCVVFSKFACAQSASGTQEIPFAHGVELEQGYDHMIVDLETHWWGGGYKMPHIRPTRGGSSSSTANDVGTIDYNASKPSFWQMAQFANVQYWNWKITHSQEMKEQIRVQWRYIRSVYSDQELSSADKSVGIVNVSDDAAWELNYLMQVHEVLGDKQSLDDATILLPNILNRFADPYPPRVS